MSKPTELIAILVDRRRRLGLTQAEVGNAIDAAPSEVGRWEISHRMPQVETLIRWAAALGGEVQIVFTKDRR
jgi:transcriptional regulator with XRE-family HTH domain